MNYSILLIFLLGCFTCTAQEFYVTSYSPWPSENRVFLANLNNSSLAPVPTCPPTNDAFQAPEQQFTDMAINSSNELFFVSGGGSLYKKGIDNADACIFLGTFGTTINSLVADSNHYLYGTANVNGICSLYRFDSQLNTFSNLGSLPAGNFSAGDLFYYENQLYLTGTDTYFELGYLVEVNIENPSASCRYMELGDLISFGAFATSEGNQSRAFIISHEISTTQTILTEIDIANKILGATLRTFPFSINGAATYYGQCSNVSECLSLSIDNYTTNEEFFTVLNPTRTYLEFTTNIGLDEINQLILYDINGRVVRQFDSVDSARLDTSGIASGMYILQVTLNTKSFVRKVVIE